MIRQIREQINRGEVAALVSSHSTAVLVTAMPPGTWLRRVVEGKANAVGVRTLDECGVFNGITEGELRGALKAWAHQGKAAIVVDLLEKGLGGVRVDEAGWCHGVEQAADSLARHTNLLLRRMLQWGRQAGFSLNGVQQALDNALLVSVRTANGRRPRHAPSKTRILLEAGADPNAAVDSAPLLRSCGGRTRPLHAALLLPISEQTWEVLDLLIQHGARLGERDAEGKTAWDRVSEMQLTVPAPMQPRYAAFVASCMDASLHPPRGRTKPRL